MAHYIVCKPFTALSRDLKRGDVVSDSGWPHRRAEKLVEGHMLRPLTEQETLEHFGADTGRKRKGG